MITSINNYQSNLNFNASMKVPKFRKTKAKLQPFISEKQSKLREFGAKIKNDFINLDEESRELLYKSIILLSIITVVLVKIGLFVKAVMDKIHYLTE